MSVGTALRDLGRFLDECEETGTVSAVKLTDSSEPEAVTAEVRLALAAATDELDLRETNIDADGRFQVAYETPDPILPTADHNVTVEPTATRVTRDGALEVTVAVSAVTEADPTDERERAMPDSTAEASAVTRRDRDVPPFRDPELLEEVYESCDTFAEMTDALGMDVTAETVRRYMVDYDIHTPNSYDTGDGEDDDAAGGEESVVLADGIGLPDDVTIDALIETVKRANTIHEVKQEIGIEREDALEMLRELNLLDLVVGRLATEAERDITREQVVDRLRQASATA